MVLLNRFSLAFLVGAALGPTALVGQALPTPDQAKRLLQQPGAAAQVRARIGSSGLTPDQIRARLRAAGYSENLLDAYFAGSADTSSAAPGEDVMKAVRFLGLVDAQEQDSLTAIRVAADSGRRVTPGLAPVERAAAAPRSRIFGLDVFRRSTSQFEPDLAGPVDATYKLGPRDVVVVILTGGVENSYSLEVTREGFVVIPQVGQIYVANLTLDQATDVLYRRMGSVYSGLGRGANAATKLFVTVARLRANQVFVVGDVQIPGSYQLSSAGTMLTALYAAGGPTDNGNLRGIELRRGGKVVSKLDVYAYLTSGDAAKDLRLETGDVLFVPVHGARVEISGAVIRPAIYEMGAGETLRDLVRLAGGFTATASRQRLHVRRIVPPAQRVEGGRDRTVVDVVSDDLRGANAPLFPLVDGDQVEVFGIADKVRNRISVTGAVWTPGNQGFVSGMKLSDALKGAGGVKPDVKDVQISRLQTDQTRLELRATFRDTLGALTTDVPLQEDDSVTVFGLTDFRPNRYVAITGLVRKPGRYPWHERMTLRDLLHYADGLSDGAYLEHAEIARIPLNRPVGMLATTVNVAMDSSYLLERGIDGSYKGPAGLPTRSSGAPDVVLQPYDNVLILQQPDWNLDRSVTIRGEVQFPGEYVLTSKNERVADIVRRSGGLTPVAYSAGVVFTRPQASVGRIAINLERALRDTSYRDNIVMQPNDTIYVPPYRSVVDVRGAVHSPIAVAYSPGKNINYYIDAAGGETYNADKGRAYVQQPNGVVEPYDSRFLFIPDGKPDPLPGAVVVVPAKDPTDKKDWTAIVGSVAQVLASTVAIVAVLSRQ
jgi:polysaccharide export outer membrane protein